MASKGFDELNRELSGIAGRAKNLAPALKAVGRVAVNRHKSYFRGGGDQLQAGGGPPGDQWPGLSPYTVELKTNTRLKDRRGYRGGAKNQKLVNTGMLSNGYEYEVTGPGTVQVFNNEDEKVRKLQVEGVGRNGKKFKLLAVDLEKDDPELMQQANEIVADFLFNGKGA